MTECLYFHQGDDERGFIEIEDAVDDWFSTREFTIDSWPQNLTVHEYSVLPKGDSGCNKIPTGREIVELIVDRFGEDCGMEGMWEEYADIDGDPDVVAAFDAAREVLVSKQQYRVACALQRAHSLIVLGDGTWQRWSVDATV